MDSQVHERSPGTIRSSTTSTLSFEESLHGIEQEHERFTQWPAFTVEEEYKKRFNRNTIMSTAAAVSTSIFFPTRSHEPVDTTILRHIGRLFTRFPIRDSSWLVASLFSIGSALFVANAFFLLLPVIAPQTDFAGEVAYATPGSSVFGTLLFSFGGYAGWLEGLNWKRGGAATTLEGVSIEVLELSAKERKLKDEEDVQDPTSTSDSDSDSTTGSFASRQPPLHLTDGPRATTQQLADEAMASPTATWQPALIGDDAFIWWPTMQQYRRVYWNDKTFNAGMNQWLGTIVFAVATITAVPGVADLTNTTIFYYANLLPATLGGFLFLIAAIFQMGAAQEKWYLPRPLHLDWQIGFWNAIGSVGFTLAGALFYPGTAALSLQATLASFWGSWAYLIGSVLQWYLVMGNYP
ncbi:hypothetical protein BP5796_05790 [Coleophoma crateriformis]|uniref:Integral membrane protein n=1 Tax=Coleophoma crateriformis TaxID=565419 RepID=A0A3D8RVD2_9HELO|nr:hypothetical protein BP5796_05790 [Coleophoma crateriformis]